MSSYLANPIVFLIQTLFGIYIALVLLRFILQWARADFYNPISQLVVKLTSPVLRPLRQLIPGYGGIDLASLVLAWLLQALELALLCLLLDLERNVLGALAWAVPALVSLAINMILFGIFIRVILSWINPDPYNPAIGLLDRLTDPFLRPARRLIRPLSGLDLSPMVVMIALVVLEMLIIPPLKLVTASPF
ncbi:MAG: YggT family protein [Chromatiaceae bacterium]|jgi:YggT family protein